MGKKKDGQSLGRTLIKNHRSGGQQHRVSSTHRHTTELNDNSNDWARLNLHSITEQTNIDEFLATAELAGVEFTAEKENIKFVSAKSIAHLPTEQEISVIKDAQVKFKSNLGIPRRPGWDENTTAEQLSEKERECFLTWHKELAKLQEQEGILLTPYEKNLEFWRQLWRVVERSDIVVQIVDARNPLLFWCEDLENYVKEVNSNKVNMVLLNKADFLSANQREMWAKYFEERGMVALFFSALSHLKEQPSSESEHYSDSESDLDSDQGSILKVDETPVNPAEAVSQGKIFTREELEEFWLALPTAEKVKEGITTVGLVGYPNVGKSSTINALLQFKKVSVSATPGKTKHFQTLMLSEDLCLCDCPGLVFPSFVSTKAEMIINGILPIDKMLQCMPPVALIMIPGHVFEKTYGVMLSADKSKVQTSAEELLNAYGYMRGFMTQRGLPDGARSSRIILKDFVNGKLLFCQAPPDVDQETYHPFPLPPTPASVQPRITPAQHKLFSQGKVSSKDLEEMFFKKANLGAHKKGEVAADSKDVDGDKPWRKHHNRNKKEKLRRVYACHDN